MVNHSGKNGTNNGTFPRDHELKKILFEYARRSLSLNTRLRYLEEDHQIKIGLTKLKELNKKFSVPSAHKFTEVEEATTVIANIIACDVFRGQGPGTVKIIASLRLNLTIPRDPLTCANLVGERDRRNNLGIFQEIHVDGHEKLGEKALRMGAGAIQRKPHGAACGFAQCTKATCGSCGFCTNSLFGGISMQVTFDGGSELGWLAAFQTTLREIFATELSPEEWKPVVAVQSSSNIPIESTWSYDRKFNGRSIREVLEEGHIHLIPGDVVHTYIGLDKFVDYFNNKRTRKQQNRILPSGVAPDVVFDMPGDYGLENLAIPVTQEAIDELRALIVDYKPPLPAFQIGKAMFSEVSARQNLL
ncbi:hypothetical protein DFH08DRAFT_802106 [Mycena albidolilacea]|uniref:Uncharacterized protein n=1 Tax=Mycena albidolilacea TaxID=1033008 RepID=A0AAD7EXY2_9AGAR|nr:hypothetical protein DFH08DRAFT_802106 [Mycena albidolilacea]